MTVFRMNKKGADFLEIMFILLIDLILLLSFYLIIAKQVYNLDNNVDFMKRFTAKNLAYMVDTVYTTPYPLQVYYDEKSFNFIYLFKNNSVYVYDASEVLRLSKKYTYIEDKGKKFIEKEINPIQIDEKNKYTPVVFSSDYYNLEPMEAIFVK